MTPAANKLKTYYTAQPKNITRKKYSIIHNDSKGVLKKYSHHFKIIIIKQILEVTKTIL